MGEGILKHLSNKYNLDLEVESAGIAAYDGDGPSNNAILAMDKLKIDISDYISSQLHLDLVENADVILAMTKYHKDSIIKRFPNSLNKIYLLNEYAFGTKEDIEDPYGGNLGHYEKARDEIYIALEKIVEKLTGNN